MKKYLDEEGLRVLAENIGGGTDGKVPPLTSIRARI